MFVASLKMGEVVVEAVPQLATQWIYVALHPSTEGFNTLQSASVATSTISLVFFLTNFVAFYRKAQFVSKKYPPAASLIPMFLLFLNVMRLTYLRNALGDLYLLGLLRIGY